MTKIILDYFLPAKADNTIRGTKLPFYFFLLITMIGTVRSFIHIFSPDGGAGSIAGMDLSVAGADGIIFAFALWGSAQLIYAMIQWVVILRYRALIPFMWFIQLLETLLRMFVGRIKPVTFAHTPPGAFENYIYLVLAVLILALSLWYAFKQANEIKKSR
ncbi:MAG: hypothetical protein WAV05_06960 [Anaerolineales bacterium]